jgi:regulator of cell morphogenesis and NO signaling
MAKQVFNASMKLADLIDQSSNLLRIITRTGLSFGFGEATVEEACRRAGVDPATFLLICNVYSFDGFVPSPDELRKADIRGIVSYLRASHDFYLKTALQTLSESIARMLEPCEESRKNIIRKFFAEYKVELEKHFEYEEVKVFPYVVALIDGKEHPAFSIRQFEKHHSNLLEKLGDLKDLIMKYLPQECEADRIGDVLSYLYFLKDDLARHTSIEDNVLVPMIADLERNGLVASGGISSKTAAEEALSDREKEILTCVAKGMLNKEIADRFSLSIHTVITHRKNITRKIGIKTVAGLTVYAILNGLIDINSIEQQ